MPSYFYHLSLEIFGPQTSFATSSLALDTAIEALEPFQNRPRLSSPSHSAASNLRGIEKHDKTPRIISHGPRSSWPDSASTHQTSSPNNSAADHTDITQHILSPDTDLRTGPISIECIDMVAPESMRAHRRPPSEEANLVTAGIGTEILGGLRTKARYIPLDQKAGDSIYGVVHLYRDSQETHYLASNNDDYPTYLKGSSATARQPGQQQSSAIEPSINHSHGRSKRSADMKAFPFPATAASSSVQSPNVADECRTLCILAVPSYLSPSDFLGFVGEKMLDDVSHFRMIRTPRANRYMVLMKFRDGRTAIKWQKEWNGKVFNSMEPETCHVVFVKSVEIQVVDSQPQSSFPPTEPGPLSPSGQATLSTKPLAPPTPALIELPTCPVCLERMDETTGLLTIICQHVFHCTCLQKWKGSGCPVCRYTQDGFYKGMDGSESDEDPAKCSVCHSEENLWACLICGKIGCGRYDGAHAFEHWKETAHEFAIDLNSQRVWHYLGDAYVHRIIQSKTDGKLVELPAADDSALDPPDWADAVPREKLENMSLEYTHLLTSQLESQRAYFEEIVERAADKASQATAAAVAAEQAANAAIKRLEDLQSKYDTLHDETIPSLEKDRTRLEKRSANFESLARRLEKDYREEKSMNQSLMERVDIFTKENGSLKAEKLDLEEQNRDLTFFISGSQRLQGQSEDITQGTVSVPEPETKKKKNKGKGKK
ncbi:uncharacterized protein N7484_005251 [Penicillium longicatenatum]|uniref:uncharacterized protein n=1 Tax=Penicillium longicatenatum TaxID=1561947 RepID=UPI002546A548|nr:uncharacterized protein N7484_005251 [Penicillium longicatenatum]KAJ5651528.1 hypothetical protein N7484_005251 [Penicillium longicatenatum]